MAVPDWEILGTSVSEGSTIIRSNDIETVCHQKNQSNDVKYITHMQSVLAVQIICHP